MLRHRLPYGTSPKLNSQPVLTKLVKNYSVHSEEDTHSSAMVDTGRSEYIEERLSMRSIAISAEDIMSIGLLRALTKTMSPNQSQHL